MSENKPGRPAKYVGRWDPELEPRWQSAQRLLQEGRLEEFRKYQVWFFELYNIRKIGKQKQTLVQKKAYDEVVRRFPPILEPGYEKEQAKAEELRMLDLDEEAEKKKTVQTREDLAKIRKEQAREEKKLARQEQKNKVRRELIDYKRQVLLDAKRISSEESRLKKEEEQIKQGIKLTSKQTASTSASIPDDDLDPEIAAQLQELADGGFEFDIDRDWEWAFNNQALKVMPRDAPSPGAWKILEYARNNSVKFTEKTLQWAEKRRKEMTAADREHEEDQRTQFKMIERMERNIRSSSDSVVTDLAKQFPAEVAQSLRKLGWSVSFPVGEKSAV
jgi:hypothetical protein